MAHKDIDIESLQHEILAAETYLKSNDPEQVRTSLSRIDDTRKSDILQQMGRKPLSSANLTASVEQWEAREARESNYYDARSEASSSAANSPDSVDMGARAERARESREGLDTSIDSTNRYSDPALREQLISRLLADQRSKQSAGSSSFRSYDQRQGSEGDGEGEGKDEGEGEGEGEGSGPASADNEEIFFASDLPTPYKYPYPFEEGGQGVQGQERAEDLEQMMTLKVFQAWGEAPPQKNSSSSSRGGVRGAQGRGKGVTIAGPDRARSTSSGRSGSSGGSDRVRYKNHHDEEDDNEAPGERSRDRGGRGGTEGGGAAESEVKFRYLKSKDDLQQEAETVFRREFRFTPALSQKVQRYSSAQGALQASKRGGASSSGAGAGAGGQATLAQRNQSLAARIEEINLKHQRALEARERVRRETERQELADCTFQPTICKNTDSIISKRTRERPSEKAAREAKIGPNAHPAAVAGYRLHSEAAARAEQQRTLQHNVLEARQADYTFQPERASAASSAGRALEANVEHRPIFERVAEMQRHKIKTLADLRSSHEAQQNEALTFNPQIDGRSRQMALALNPQKDTPAGERLHQEQSLQQKRHQQRLMQHARIEAENAKHPQVSRGSARIAQATPALHQPFEARQEQYQKAVQRRTDARRKQEEDSQEAWFKPEIGKSAAIVAMRRPELLSETDEERATRLSAQDTADIASRKSAIEKEVYKDITFHPTLDPVSAALGKKSSLQDLVDNPKGKSVRERARRQHEAQFENECSFHPHVLDYRIDTSATSMYDGPPSYRYEMEHSIDGWASASQAAGDRGDKENSGVVQAKINIREPEKMARDIRLHLQEREERRRADLMARELEMLKECTFAPTVPSLPADHGELQHDMPFPCCFSPPSLLVYKQIPIADPNPNANANANPPRILHSQTQTQANPSSCAAWGGT